MKIGRNDLCPCGSGKKYKKCCIGQNITAENKYEDAAFGEQDELGEQDEQDDFGFDVMNKLHSFLLEKKPHIKEYKKIRKLHGEIIDSMINYFDDGKFEQKIDADYTSRLTSGHKKIDDTKGDTFIFLDSNFDMDTRESVHGFYDMMIYKPAPNMNCITEEFIKSHKYRKPEKIEFLQSMLDSKLGLFEITGVDFGNGYVYIKEVFTGSEYKMTDIGLSGSKNYDDFYIYMRIITYHNISFGTGFNLSFIKTDPFIESYIERQKQDYKPLGEFRRFIELYNRFSKEHKKVKVIANTY